MDEQEWLRATRRALAAIARWFPRCSEPDFYLRGSAIRDPERGWEGALVPDFPAAGSVYLRWQTDEARVRAGLLPDTGGELHLRTVLETDVVFQTPASNLISPVHSDEERAWLTGASWLADTPDSGDGTGVLAVADEAGVKELVHLSAGALLPMRLTFDDYLAAAAAFRGLSGLAWCFVDLDAVTFADGVTRQRLDVFRSDQPAIVEAVRDQARRLFPDADLALLEPGRPRGKARPGARPRRWRRGDARGE